MKIKKSIAFLLSAVMAVACLIPQTGWASADEGGGFDVEAACEQLIQMDSDEEISAYLGTLSEDECGLLVDYVTENRDELFGEESEKIETVPFTEAGPFMPAVKVKSTKKPALKAGGSANGSDPYDPDGNGLSMNKTVTKNSDGTFKVRLEAWSTGEVRTETVTTPVDIVIVIDQSESMGYDFAGNDEIRQATTRWPYYEIVPIPEGDTRQYAMKNAVKSFINQVADKYSASDSDHRMAVVTFGNSASTLIDWTDIDASGKTAVTNAINGLPTYPTATTSNTGTGMTLAESLISGSGYSYSGSNTTRNKVVIVFTDGIPGASSLDVTQANTALSSSYRMKDSGVTMYSVGIFNGADPNQLYGEKWSYQIFDDILCSGQTGSYWGGSWLASIVGNNDFDSLDIPSGNRFLNYLSSNFMSATEIGITKGSYDPGNHSSSWVSAYGTGYRIDTNSTRDASGYYLTANDSSGLSNIFEAINTNIENPKIELGAAAEIREALSQYFTVSGGASDVSVKTASYDGTQFSTTETSFNGADVDISDGVLNVSGFDYAANFVSDTVKTDGTYGKKLIVEFNVTPDSDLLGGNDIPIDMDTSGIYAVKEGEMTRVEAIPVSSGNVAVRNFEVVDSSVNVYRGTELSDDDIAGTVTTQNVNLDDSNWIADFVNISSTVADAGTGTHDVTVTVSPKTNGQNSVGTPATAVSDTGTVAENIFDPQIVFKDSEVYLGETVPSNFDGNLVGSVTWKNDDLNKYSTEVTMFTDEPEIDYTYTPASTGTVSSMDDIGVTVTAGSTIGTESVDYSSFVTHQDCQAGESLSGYSLLLHVKSCTLTISKTGAQSIDDNQSFIFNVKSSNGAIDTDVVITGNGSVNVTGLPVGNYTVTENSDWSWRYTPVQSTKTIVLNNGQGSTGTLTFSNSRAVSKWLSGDSICLNAFR